MLTDKQRLQALLNTPDWTPADREWLLSYLEGTDQTNLKTLMEEIYSVDPGAAQALGDISSLMRQQISARTGIDMDRHALLQSVGDQPATGKSSYRKLRWWTAAAALILLIGGAWIYIAGRDTPSETANQHRTYSHDAPPGRSMAFLTMSDGRTIPLDSAATGELALQGHTKIIKQDSGLVTYHAALATRNADSISLTYNTITTPRGGQYQVVLPDGTKVWLNAASSLKFPTAFTGKERRVELIGEGYFEVTTRFDPAANGKPHEKIPFIVQIPPAAQRAGAASQEIEVLGTHFNVNAYKDDPAARTTLLEGSIRIRKGASTNILRPGQQALLDNGNDHIDISNDADMDEAVAWKNGMFIFNSLSLDAVMRQMQRWYDVEIVYEGSGSAKNVSFNGQISRYSNASKMLDMLATTGEVHFEMANKKIIVRP